MFSENLQILARSQISLDPQNPASWLCGVSKLFSPNVLKIYLSLNPQYPTSCGCGVWCSPNPHKNWYILKSSISFILGVSGFRNSSNQSQNSNILKSSKSMILAVWGFQISFSKCTQDLYILISSISNILGARNIQTSWGWAVPSSAQLELAVYYLVAS